MGLYDNPGWAGLPGGMMRPGGMYLTDRLLQLAMLAPHSRILDLGCGLGTTAARLVALGYHSAGVDASTIHIKHGHVLYPQADLQVSSGESLLCEDKTFDAIISECSLSLMDLPAVLASCQRVLKPGGKLLISDLYALDRADPPNLAAAEIRHFLTQEEWAETLAFSSFSLIVWEDHTEVWKGFAAQILWDHGSLAPFFHCSKETLRSLGRPGYFLAVAQL